MWPETIITDIEVLPNYTIQIDFMEDWINHRAFISFWEFFEKFWTAMSKLQGMFEAYQQINQYVAHLNRKIELLDDWDNFDRLPDEKAIEGKNKLIKDSWINIEVFDMYIRWI